MLLQVLDIKSIVCYVSRHDFYKISMYIVHVALMLGTAIKCNKILVHRHMSPSDITAIQDALLRKCMNYGRVVHIIVDKRSLFVSACVSY